MLNIKKSQTSTEYLVLLAVVIVIAIIVISVLGGIPTIGSGGSKNAKLSELKTASIGVDNFFINSSYGKLLIRNNNDFSINIQNLTLDSVACTTSDLPSNVKAGQTKTVECTGSFTDHSGGSTVPEVGFKYIDLRTSAQYRTEDYSE